MTKTSDKSSYEFISEFFEKHLAKVEEMVAVAIAKILKAKMREFEQMLKQREEEIAVAVAKILKEKAGEYREMLDKYAQEKTAKFGSMEARVMELAKLGKDADEMKIIEGVLARIVLPNEELIISELTKRLPSFQSILTFSQVPKNPKKGDIIIVENTGEIFIYE